MMRCVAAVLVCSLAFTAGAAPIPDVPKADPPAEVIKKALDTVVTVEVQGQSLVEAMNTLKEKLKINIVVDRQGLLNYGINPDDPSLNIKLKDVKGRTALRQILGQFNNVSWVIEGDILCITNEFNATEKQVRQRVSVDVDKVPLEKALKDLSRQTGTNIIVDPRHAAKAKEAVSLQLDDVPLEIAVRLLAEMGGMRSVRQSNVLFVTTKEVAAELRKEEQQPHHNPFGPPVFPFFDIPRAMPAVPGVAVPDAPPPAPEPKPEPQPVPDR